jgi:hypothetical protein
VKIRLRGMPAHMPGAAFRLRLLRGSPPTRWRSATHQILPLHATCRNLHDRVGANGQASLDHRARLRGTEAGVGIEPLRGAGLARISSPRHPLPCGLWVPGGRTEKLSPEQRSAIAKKAGQVGGRVRAERLSAEEQSRIAVRAGHAGGKARAGKLSAKERKRYCPASCGSTARSPALRRCSTPIG